MELILNAFSRLPKSKIVIVGNWDIDKYSTDLREKFMNYNNIYLLDAIYDLNELNFIRSNANLYIHGHSAGGTNPALVEAMNLGLPIFAYESVYNQFTTNFKAKFFKTFEELLKLIKNSSENELSKLGIKMREIAIENYTWDIISKKYKKILNS